MDCGAEKRRVGVRTAIVKGIGIVRPREDVDGSRGAIFKGVLVWWLREIGVET